MIGTMAANIAMSASLSILWGMINALQLMVNLPLMNVNFPANAIFFYTLLMNMANLDVLPINGLEGVLFTFEEYSFPSNFQLMDIF